MRDRIEKLIMAGFFTLLLYYAFYSFLIFGFSVPGILRLGICATVLLLLSIIGLTNVWPALILGSLAFAFSVPVTILSRIEAGMYVVACIGVIFVVRSALRAPIANVFAAMETRCMFVTMAILLVRFAKDRPGSAQLTDVGGAGEATLYLFGSLAYFLTALVFAEQWDVRRNARFVLRMTVVAVLVHTGIALVRMEAFVLFVGDFFARPAWLLFPLIMAWFSERETARTGLRMRGVRMSTVAAWITFFLGIGTPFRSRPFYVIGMWFGVGSRYRRLRQMFVMLALGVVVTVGWLLVAGPDRLSARTARSLSTMIRVDEVRVASSARQLGISDELGWTSSFRAEMWRLGWENVRRHPWFGKGFVISRADLGFALSGRGDRERTLLGLAMAGGYHNSVLALAVFSGIPSAVAFMLALLVGAWRFYRLGRGTWVSDTRMLQAATLGFFFPCVGQMLMNGMGSSFYVVCVLLGAMRGFCVRDERMRRAARVAGDDPLGTELVTAATGLLTE